jgi:hypothetical protein
MFKITFTLKNSYIMIIKCTIWEHIIIFLSLLIQKQKNKNKNNLYISFTYNLLGKSQISLRVDAFKKDWLECILKMCFVNLY